MWGEVVAATSEYLEVKFPNGVVSKMNGECKGEAFVPGERVYVENYRGSRFICTEMDDVQEAKAMIDGDIENAIKTGTCVSCKRAKPDRSGYCAACLFRNESGRKLKLPRLIFGL